MRNEKGITLIALILIIVVLVILAGISISLVVNNETDKVEINPNTSSNEPAVVPGEVETPEEPVSPTENSTESTETPVETENDTADTNTVSE